jgi:hypothetical protein
MTNNNGTEVKMSYYGSSIAMGLAGEKTVRQYLEGMGIETADSTKYENIMQDVDCWITVDRQLTDIGVEPGCYPLSIKRQEAGIKYGNVGFELYQQETLKDGDTRTDEERWVKTGWYHTGVCPIYAVLQGNKIRLFTKLAVQNTLKSRNGWLRKCTLTARLKDAISKTARYSDALCGYLNIKDIHQIELNTNDQSKTVIRPATLDSIGTLAA